MIEHLPAELLDHLLGGHTGYGTALRESRGPDGEGGVGIGWIVAVVLLAIGTTVLVIWVSSATARMRLKKAGPGVLIATVMAAPLGVWAITSGESRPGLIVERGKTPTGAPEFIVSLPKHELNSLAMTKGKRAVQVECLGSDGNVVLEVKQRWPFNNERGYDDPHAHLALSSEQLLRADRCLVRGTSVRLEADVEGAPAG